MVRSSEPVWSVLREHPNLYVFMWSSFVGVFFGLIIWKFFPFFLVLEHELTHFIAAILMFRKPIRLVIDQSGREIVYEGRGSTIIRLAPYFLPTFAVILLIVLPLSVPSAHRPIHIMIAMAWGYHLITGFIEGHPGQPDLRRGGLFASYLYTISLGGIVYAIVAVATIAGWQTVRVWVQGSLNLATKTLGFLA